MSTYTDQYNFHVRRINGLRRAIDGINYESSLQGLDGKNKLTKEQKEEKKRLQKLEKEERKALNKLTSNKERKQIAKQTKKETKQFRKQIKKGGLTGFVALLNESGPATLPLTETEEQFRAASVAGDFGLMNQIAPFGPAALMWGKNTSLGKYRFEIQNGNLIYIPWSERDINNYVNGPWAQKSTETGLAPLIDPRRKKITDVAGKIKNYIKRQEKASRKFPNTDMRHVAEFTPGRYMYDSGKESTWVKIRTPVMVAVAAVAAVYLGPTALNAVQGAMGAGTAGTAAGTAAGGAAAGTVAAQATLGAKIFAGASTLTGYINDARTVKAIAEGKMPPPPIGVTGNSFKEWAFDVAKKEAIDEYGRQLTKNEENDLRREIAAMQNQLAPVLAKVPVEPQNLPTELKQMQALEQKRQDELQKYLLPAAIVAGALLLGA